MKYTGRITVFVSTGCCAVVGFGLAAWHINPSITLPLLFIVCGVIGWWLGKRYDQVKYVSEKDVLTEVYNRRYAFDIFSKLQAKTMDANQSLSILLIDVDNLKITNDTCGLHIGDLVIQRLSFVLLNNTRRSDVVARIGGDEFLVIAPNTTKDSVLKIVQRINMELLRSSEQFPNPLSASIGIASCPSDAQTLDDLIKIADASMYQKKQEKPKIPLKARQ